MKRVLILLSILVLLISGCPAGEEYVYERNAPVYVTIYTHNEDSWSTVVSTEEKYISYRMDLVERAELLAKNDIPWNWQTDQPVVEAIIEYEDNEAILERTNGENVLVYMNSLGVQIDPHAHTNNYADIVYLIESLGGKASGVIGGTVMVECGSEHLGFLDYVNWHEQIGLKSDGYVHGKEYPTARWEPKVLSDPGMGGHWFDDWTSGVWQPGNEDDFYSHSEGNNIIYIGEGYPHDASNIGETHASGCVVHAKDAQYILELIEKIKNGEVPTGTKDNKKFMYTASVHFRDKHTVREGGSVVVTKDAIQEFIDILQPYVDQGDVIYVTFEEAAKIWLEEYDGVPWQLSLESFSFYEEVKEQAEEFCQSR